MTPLQNALGEHAILLASNSSRRKELLTKLGVPFEVIENRVKETYPKTMPCEEIAPFLAQKKAEAIPLAQNEILIAADTVVHVNGSLLDKPKNKEEAIESLQQISGKKHEVITGVCLRSHQRRDVFSSRSVVHFHPLTLAEITHYIENHNPFDKAGGYGIQEWIGLMGIKKIEGSYYNVVGLPTDMLYHRLLKMLETTN